ncbi:MAG: 30S ribosomal protein S20 [Woeseia sp.]
MHNMGLRSKMRTQIKNVLKAIEKGDQTEANAAYKEAVPVIDSMINKGIVTKNKAARHKSRLNARIKALSA